jgi:hypothetical protein
MVVLAHARASSRIDAVQISRKGPAKVATKEGERMFLEQPFTFTIW